MILCCGESLIDMLPRDSRQGEAAFAPYVGGSVFNTAIALGRLGARVGFFSGISTDLFGQMLTKALADAHVDSATALRSGRPTTLAFVTLVDGHARYAFYDEGTAGRMLTDHDLPALPDDLCACFFGGISLMVEPCAGAYEALAARAHAAGKVVMIDPNIRPGFIHDPQGYRARLGRMLAMADVVKISDEDLDWITGKTGAEGVAMLMAEGPKLVFLTVGAEGAVAYGPQGAVQRPARRVAVADTVGAGDTFNAGVLAALAEAGALDRATLAAAGPEVLAAALDLGIKAAAVTVSRPGANPPWRSEL
ncbi:carbohydrate kinase [Paracoccus sp. p4-l81]|uniref:carbohydrate kinase family protein n=1 Tax=Paracoccus sp. p4-l81 TaxID=3342806 RepID=UPI0035B83238